MNINRKRSAIALVIAIVAAIALLLGSNAGATGHPTYPPPDCYDHEYGNDWCDTVPEPTTIVDTIDVGATVPESTTTTAVTTTTTVPETTTTVPNYGEVGQDYYVQVAPTVPVDIGEPATTIKPAPPRATAPVKFTG